MRRTHDPRSPPRKHFQPSRPPPPPPPPIPAASSDHPFFKLPAELRNRIYHYALVDEGETLITHANTKQPAILLANRQLRHEASPIFYYENTFRFSCPDFDCSALASFAKHYARFWASPKAKKFKFEIPGARTSWANLLIWMKLVHARKLPALNRVSTQRATDGRTLASHAMNVVRLLRNTAVPWETVLEVLEQVRKTNPDH